MKDLSIVIVNYRVKYFLEQTLRSVIESLDKSGLSGEILVIDNHSGDDSIAFLRGRFPEVTFIENMENVGFARANNQGIRAAQGEFTLILNPDTIVSGDTLRRPVEWLRSHADCGAVGVRMTDGNGRFLPESKRSFPTPWVSFCKMFGLSALMPRSRFFAKYHLRYLDERQAHPVDILSGAFMLCRTALLQQVGGFDEDFFMYGEDIDLSYRLYKAGYQNWYLPVPMIHYKGESTRKDTVRYVRVFYEAMLIFYRKHFPQYSWLLYPPVKAAVWVRASLAALNRLIVMPVRRLFRRDKAVRRWVVVSDDPVAVARTAAIANYSTIVPDKGRVAVLLDDSSMTYDDIVRTITDNHREGLEYHIFSARNGMVISPKMTL